MSTKRARTQITHTPEIEHALDIAGAKWPGETPSRLLGRLILIGAEVLEQDTGYTARRRRRIDDLAGRYSDAFGPTYLEDVRDGWPT